jgi:hypothetical protein
VSGFAAEKQGFASERFERSRTGRASSAGSRGVMGYAV